MSVIINESTVERRSNSRRRVQGSGCIPAFILPKVTLDIINPSVYKTEITDIIFESLCSEAQHRMEKDMIFELKVLYLRQLSAAGNDEPHAIERREIIVQGLRTLGSGI